MRILVNSAVLAPIGGVEQSTLQVATRLHERGHRISALYQTTGSNAELWEQTADDLIQVPSFACTKRNVMRDLTRLPPAVRAAASVKPDIVYLNRAEQIVWGVLAARAARVPLVVHLRTHLPFPGVRIAGRVPAHYISVSNYVRDHWITAGVPADQITVVHNGIEPDAYPFGGMDERSRARTELGLPADGNVVLYYGRISPGKGVDTLIQAWERTMPDPERDRLVIVGDPGDAQEAGYAQGLRDRGTVACTWLPMRQDVMPALHAADIVVLPAQWQEPFGRVVIEGMSSGRPVIGTSVGGIPEILTGEFAQYLVAPSDVEQLADRLSGLRGWRDTDRGLGLRAREHVEQHFSLEQTVDGVERILQGAVAKGSPLHRMSARADK
jgi:glycosyltransferase involved in cell wall biosynthesis